MPQKESPRHLQSGDYASRCSRTPAPPSPPPPPPPPPTWSGTAMKLSQGEITQQRALCRTYTRALRHASLSQKTAAGNPQCCARRFSTKGNELKKHPFPDDWHLHAVFLSVHVVSLLRVQNFPLGPCSPGSMGLIEYGEHMSNPTLCVACVRARARAHVCVFAFVRALRA